MELKTNTRKEAKTKKRKNKDATYIDTHKI
jgi:hypothetical protein